MLIVVVYIINANAWADSDERVFTEEQQEAFIQKYSLKYKLPPNYIKEVLAQAKFKQASYDSQQPHPEYKGKPKSWAKYRRQFLNPTVINAGQRFMCGHRDALTKAQNRYGVPKEVIIGIIGVETSYGGFTGNFRVLDALATIAFSTPRRVDFFQNELAQYILMCYQYDLDPTSIKGSIDGGFGLSQFMPSSYIQFAVSSTDDTPNLYLADDAIMSVGNYLKEHHWQKGQPVYLNVTRTKQTCKQLECNKKDLAYSLAVFEKNGVKIKTKNELKPSTMADLIMLDDAYSNNALLALNNFYSIYSYNHSFKYSMAVYLLGKAVVSKVEKSGC